MLFFKAIAMKSLFFLKRKPYSRWFMYDFGMTLIAIVKIPRSRLHVIAPLNEGI